jgi:uncharacterized protein (TIGR02996 family)
MTTAPALRLDDPATMAVLADWLCERGDPRGALVQLQLAREERPDDARLQAAEARHVALHAKALLGPLALHQSVCRLSWQRGFVVSVALVSASRERGWARERVEPVNRLERAARALTRMPRADTVRDVRLEQPWSWFVGPHLGAAVRALCGGGLSFDRLFVATPDEVDDWWDEAPAQAAAEVVELERGSLHVTCDARVAWWVERALWT